MDEPIVIDVYDLPSFGHVYGQTLREIISLPNLTLFHITLLQRCSSLPHKHSKMNEVYFILKGEGTLYYEDKALSVREMVHHILPANTPHKLKNTGKLNLEHLVFTTPAYDSEDFEELNDSSFKKFHKKEYNYDMPPIIRPDGAIVYDLIPENKHLDFSLSRGFLPKRIKSTEHHHNISDVIVYIYSGNGLVKIDNDIHDVKKGSVVYIPKYKKHSIENTSYSDELDIITVASPKILAKDFVF